MERRTERFYVRVRPSVKKWLEQKARKDGFGKNITDWFEQTVTKWKKTDERRKQKNTKPT